MKVRITPEHRRRTHAARQRYRPYRIGIAEIISWVDFYRVVDEREMRDILAGKKIRGGKFAAPVEQAGGAQWGADQQDVIDFGLGWHKQLGPRGRLAGDLFLLKIDGHGRDFLHSSVGVLKMKEDPWAEPEKTKEIRQERIGSMGQKITRIDRVPDWGEEDFILDIDEKKLCTTGLGCSLDNVTRKDLEQVWLIEEGGQLTRAPQRGIMEYLKWKDANGLTDQVGERHGDLWERFTNERRGRKAAASWRPEVVKSLRAAAAALEGRGPTHPQAVFRFGSKPNQAPVMRFLREFLQEYAAAGNDLMEGKHPGERIERLQNLASRINMDLDELIRAVEELT